MDITVYGFVNDSLFYNKKYIDLTQVIDTGIGFLNDKMINHFHKLARITDNRTERLTILGSPIQESYSAISFDQSKFDNLDVFNLDLVQIKKLFNITETCYLTQNRTDNELNSFFLNDSESFGIYKDGSVKISTKKVETSVKINDTDVLIKVPEWVEFEVTTNGDNIKFHLWLISQAFFKNYPLSTIVKVIPPCNPEALLNPSMYSNILDSIVKSNTISFQMIDDKLKLEDVPTMMTYFTKYVQSSYSIYQMPFGILYKGAKPSTLEIRKAIREYLLSLGIAPENNWKKLFPDLFVIGQFFIIPIWDNTTQRPDRIIYPSVINYGKMLDEVVRINPNLDLSFIKKHLAVIMNGYCEVFSTILADPLNESSFSFQELHPTYVYHTRQQVGHKYMEDITREFNVYFCECIAVLLGHSTSERFTENIFDDRSYLSFVVNKIEYHVLSSNGYTFEPGD